MKKSHLNMALIGSVFAALLSNTANAGVVDVDQSAFGSSSHLIEFNELSGGLFGSSVGIENPVFNPSDYGGSAGDTIVSFSGLFQGQSISTNPAVDCPGMTSVMDEACVVGTPTGTLAFSSTDPEAKILTDGSVDGEILTPINTYYGPLAILFSEDQYGVGLDAGVFNIIGSVEMTAFSRDGTNLGSLMNETDSSGEYEFMGLASDNGMASIAGIFIDLNKEDASGYAMDNLRFMSAPSSAIPEPSMFAMLGLGLTLLGLRRRKVK